MTIEERKQFINNYLDQLEKEIETLKENISEFKENLEKAQTHYDIEMLMHPDKKND